MTRLDIGDVKPDRKRHPLSKPAAAEDRCPRCGKGPEARIDGSGFGGAVIVNCGFCGYEFPPKQG